MAGEFSANTAGTFKRVHRSTCRYARRPYPWADQFEGDEVALLAELMWNGGVMWHLGCSACCPDLDSGIREAQRQHVRNVVMAHLSAYDSAPSSSTPQEPPRG